MSKKQGLSAPVASAPSRRVTQGPVMPIGGAEETEPGGEILERFVDLAGGKKARIAIIPTASDDPQRSGDGYAQLFREMGAAKADWLRVERREDANAEEALSLLQEATGIYITGAIRPGWWSCRWHASDGVHPDAQRRWRHRRRHQRRRLDPVGPHDGRWHGDRRRFQWARPRARGWST